MIPAAGALNSPLLNSRSDHGIARHGRDTTDFAFDMRQSNSVDSGLNVHIDHDDDLYPSHMESHYEDRMDEDVQAEIAEDQEIHIDDDQSDPDYVPEIKSDGRTSRTSARVREREAKRKTKKTETKIEDVPKKPAVKRGRRKIIKEELDSDYFEDVES